MKSETPIVLLMLSLVIFIVVMFTIEHREVVRLERELARCEAHAVELNWLRQLPGSCDAGCP